MLLRDYDPATDRVAALRIFREVGWIADEKHEKAADGIFDVGRTLVTDLDGSVECLVSSHPGTIRHLHEDLDLTAVTGVVTSRVARKRGLASRLTARLLAEDALAGSHVAVLGIFEQGFYNQLGFGNGSYEHWYALDPARLRVPAASRVPVRLGSENWREMHENRLRRRRTHGSCSLVSPEMTKAEVLWSENGFGLGFRAEDGTLSHHVWCTAKEAEHGPYTVLWMAYATRAQFLELLGLLKNLGDQVRTIKLDEPPGIQLLDLVEQPFKTRQMTHQTPNEARMTASPYWQARILDLTTCIARTRLAQGEVRFQLDLTDPVARFLGADAGWRGTSGSYVVTLGRESHCASGQDADLPTLRASINAFTRLWLGVRSVTSLHWTDDLEGPAELLAQLDEILRLPTPRPDWEF